MTEITNPKDRRREAVGWRNSSRLRPAAYRLFRTFSFRISKLFRISGLVLRASLTVVGWVLNPRVTTSRAQTRGSRTHPTVVKPRTQCVILSEAKDLGRDLKMTLLKRPADETRSWRREAVGWRNSSGLRPPASGLPLLSAREMEVVGWASAHAVFSRDTLHAGSWK